MFEGPRGRLAAAALLAVASLGVYANSLHGPFVFDDIFSITEDPLVASPWPPFEARPGSGASGRPLVALTLKLNHALGGLEVFGYHLLNVVLHVLTSWTLFGLARRALARTVLDEVATGTGLAIALLWCVHPLTSDALNLVVTRSEVLLALFYLLTLYATDRGLDGDPGGRWRLVGWLACAAAMASKEIAVSLPLAALAYDRTFSGGSFAASWRERRGYFLGLGATWIVLGLFYDKDVALFGSLAAGLVVGRQRRDQQPNLDRVAAIAAVGGEPQARKRRIVLDGADVEIGQHLSAQPDPLQAAVSGLHFDGLGDQIARVQPLHRRLGYGPACHGIHSAWRSFFERISVAIYNFHFISLCYF